MRLEASFGVIGGVVWLASAVAVPRLEDAFESSCSNSDVGEATTVVSTATCSGTALEATTTALPVPNSSRTASEQTIGPVTKTSSAPRTVTVTITPSTVSSVSTGDSVLPGFIPPNSSSIGFSSGLSGPVSFSCTSSGTARSVSRSSGGIPPPHTITVTKYTPFSTSIESAPSTTLALPVLSSTAAESVVTVNVSDGSVVEVIAATVPESTVTMVVPKPSQRGATSVLALTFPDGPSHTATLLVTVTIPELSLTPSLWSTVVTPSITAPLSSSQPSNLHRPYVLTYTLSPDSGIPTPFTGTITITPSPLSNRVTPSSQPMNSSQSTGIVGSTIPLAPVSAARPPGPIPSGATVALTVAVGHTPSAHTGIPTATQLVPAVSGSPIVTVLTPHPISNTLGPVPIVPLTLTVTLYPEDPATSTTIQTAPPMALQTGGLNGGLAVPSSTVQPELITVTVTAAGSSSSNSASLGFSALGTAMQSASSTAAVPEPFSYSSGNAVPYGPGANTYSGTITVTLPLSISTASSLPTRETGLSSVSISTLETSQASEYGPFSLASSSNSSPVVITITQPLYTSWPTPSSPIASAPTPSRGGTNSVVLVTYTVADQSGTGASSYTVTYTLPPSITSSVETGKDPRSSFSHPTPTWTLGLPSVATTIIVGSSAPGYGTLFSSPPGASSATTPSLTKFPSSGSTVGRTTSDADALTTEPAGQPIVVTVTEIVSSDSATVVHSSDTVPSTHSNSYQNKSTKSVLPAPASSQPMVVTVTEGVSSAPTSPSVLTVVVSAVTLTQTVPIGYGSSTIIKFTTEVTVVPGSGSLTASSSTVVVTSLSPTWTVFPPLLTSLEPELTTVPFSSNWPSVTNDTETGPTRPPTVVTIWPPLTPSWSSVSGPVVTSHSVSSTDMESPELGSTCTSIVNLEPTSAVSEKSSALQSVNATVAQSFTIVPSDVSILPSVTFNSSCSTFSTSYPSPSMTMPLFSVTTLMPVPTSTTLGSVPKPSSCTETLSGASAAMSTNIPPIDTSVSQISTGTTLPPQTEFHHPAHAATDNSVIISTSTVGGYVFSTSNGGYGNPGPGYGNPSQVTITVLPTNSFSFTDTELPSSHSTSASLTPLGYGATTIHVTESADPNAASRSVSSTGMELSTTTVTHPEIASTTLSGIPLPIITSLGPTNPTSTLISPSSSRVSTTPLLSITTPQFSTISQASQSSVWANSTALTPSSAQSSVWVNSTNPTSSSQVLASSTASLPGAPNITSTFPVSPPPSTVNNTIASSATIPPSSVSDSATVHINSTVAASPVIMTLTMTTTFTAGTDSTGFTLGPGIQSSAADATSRLTLPTAASSTIANPTSMPPPPSTTLSEESTITSSTGSSTNATQLTNPPAISSHTTFLLTSRPLLNTTFRSTPSVIITATVIPSVPTVFFNSSSTAVPFSTLPAAFNITNSASSTFVNSTAPLITSSATSTFVNDTASVPTEFVASTTPAITSNLSSMITSKLLSSSVHTATIVNSTPSDTVAASPILPARSIACGAEGDRGVVVFEFDDIEGNEGVDQIGIHHQPIPSPYHRFFFSSGFHVDSPQTSKFEPSSGSQMLQHNVSSSAQIGLAQLRGNPCFRFDLESISLGCDSTDAPCTFQVTALQWDGVEDVVQGDTTFKTVACPLSSDCDLSPQMLDPAVAPSFVNLTAINITLATSSNSQNWWADDLRITWTDNDCPAAACRAEVPNGIITPPPHAFAGTAKRLLRWAVRG